MFKKTDTAREKEHPGKVKGRTGKMERQRERERERENEAHGVIMSSTKSFTPPM